MERQNILLPTSVATHESTRMEKPMTTTREQRLRELQLEMYAWECENLKAWERRFSEELATILNEPVEVSEEMLNAAGEAIEYFLDEYSMRLALHAALNLKEPGQ